ncbi:hypothetical protein ACWGTI_03475 [Mesorhizobium sp. ArgA1]
MTLRAKKFLDEWIEKHDVIQTCSGRDQSKISALADRLIADAEAEGLSESELTEAFEVHENSALADVLLPKT